MVSNYLTINPESLQVKNSEDVIKFNLKFLPFKPLQTTVYLVLDRQGGGRYKYEIQLESKQPEIDDTIILESTLNKATGSKFKIKNPFDSESKFTATIFSKDSCFKVSPQTGVLRNDATTDFTVLYKPSE